MAGTLALDPIGTLRCGLVERAQAPRQPRAALGIEGTIELFPGRGYEDALADLEGWQYVWILAWFDRNQGWRPKVLPPRSHKKRGVFSTRSPHRPNPIALSVFELVGVEGLSLRVRNVDLLDGTPVLDIKPYVPWADSIPDAGTGWLAEEGAGVVDPGPSFEVGFEDDARRTLALLAEHGVELEPAIVRSLSLGPSPHAYRRIKAVGEGYVLALKSWRVSFRVDARAILVTAIRSGEKPSELARRPEDDVHRRVEARYDREPVP